jgi:hypothetical protein
MRIIEQIEKFNIAEDDILQVKTDCIVVKNRKKYIKNFVSSNKFYGWKECKRIILLNQNPKVYDTEDLTFFNETLDNENFALNENAGGGKTYRIINDVIPNLNDDYVVIAYQHSTLEEYRKKKINNNTIDHYVNNDIIPKEKYIIVDELGLLKECHILFILELYYKYKKIIYLYGDNSQLPPAFNELGSVSTDFLKYFCKTYNNTEWKNYRNDFTNKDYQKMKNINMFGDLDNPNKDDLEYINELLDKYTVNNIEEANHFIAYRNKTLKTLKQEVLNIKNLEFDKENNKISKGLKVVNQVNNLRYEDTQIYNKQILTVIKHDDNFIYLNDDMDKQIKLPINKFWSSFDIANIETLYSCQGKTLQKIYFDRRDIYFLYAIPNALYTLISRFQK